MSQGLYERVAKALDTLRSHLQADGGDVELVQVTEEGVVKLRFLGSCRSCPSQELFTRYSIEEAIRGAVPEVTRIIVVE